MSVGPLQQLLSKDLPVILDGATGTELQRRGVNTGLPLWSANALLKQPDVVGQIHADYLTAGAQILTANTFRTTRRTFRHANLSDQSAALTKLAVELAGTARDHSGRPDILIAGSMAPLEDCYRPDLVPSVDELRDEHAELAQRLADAGVDFILLETMNTIREARAACEAAVATGKEVVVSFICDRAGNLYGGEPLADAIRTIVPVGPVGFSINCVSPRFLMPNIHIARATTDLPLGVYANIGIPENEKRGWAFTQDIGPGEYATYAGDWMHQGVAMIGGCCGTTPEYIDALVRALHPER
jgi:S-methylmethionine-dependent homocysteine/selenocysteine methylase